MKSEYSSVITQIYIFGQLRKVRLGKKARSRRTSESSISNTDVPFEAIGPEMQAWVVEQQKSRHTAEGLPEEDFVFKTLKPRRLLVSGMRGERLFLATPLFKFYLEYGLQVSRIHQVLEFQTAPAFTSFIDELTEQRQSSDEDPDLKVMGDCSKLMLNSGYGSLILDRTRHNDVTYVRGKQRVTCPSKIHVSKT